MARRQPAAPLDTVDAQADPTQTSEASFDAAAPISDTAPSESPEITAPTPAKPRRTRSPKVAPENSEAIAAASAETAPTEETAPVPRPRRTRKPLAEVAAPAEANDTPVELAPIAPPRRTRTRRTPATEPATFDDVPVATSDAPDAAEDIEEVFDLPEETIAEPDDEKAMEEIRAESEAILEEVLAESPTESNRSRNRNRRGRGRGKTTTDETASQPTAANVAAQAVSPNGVFRKRGAAILARTMPLPALPVTGDLPAPAPEIMPVLRKRGVRTPLTMRRIVTPDGVSVVSAAQAAALIGSVVMVPARIGDADAPVSLVPMIEPPAPEYTPLAAELLERLPQVAVVRVNGLPELHVNNAPVLPAFLFVNTEVADEPEVAMEIAVREVKRAYAAGVRLFTLLAHLPWRRKSGDRRYDSIDTVLSLVAENAPDALVLPRLIFSPPVSWERANPDDMAQYTNNEPGDVSIGSDAFWQEEAKDALRAAVEYIAQSDHAERVLGVYLEHGEWFHSKGVGADRSPANIAGFRAFLKAHYNNSEVALRSAWHDGSVTFDTAEIPTSETFAGLSANGTQPVFLGEREQRVGDFHRYTSRMTAERITYLAQIAKEASGGRLAVAVSYGYTLEIARPNCGHYALGEVLASPDVDILTAPLSYTGRLPGGSAPLPVPVDSVHLAGKLFVCEDDTKTYLALRPTDDDYNPKIVTESDTRAVHARNIGTAIAKGCGISWMDLWGEGWLDDDATWEHLGGLLNVMNTAAMLRREATHPVAAPQVAVFVDEEAFFEVADNGDSPILTQLIGQHRDTFARAGASVGYYLFSDLIKEAFPETPTLFVFLNTFCLPLDIRNAIKTRWQNSGRTFAWLYAPGVRETGNIAEFSETLGFQLRLQPWGSRTGTVVTDGRSVLTENAKGERFGEEKRINPSLGVVDPKAQILGEYVGSGNPSLAYRKHARWQSVFVGERELPLPLVRGLYRLAGIKVATPSDDAVAVAGDGFVAIHSPRDGNTAVYSPTRAESAVYDALSGELVAGTGYGAQIETSKSATRLLFFASADELTTRFGVSGEMRESAPEALSQSDLPLLGKSFEFEAAPITETRRPPVSTPPAAPPGPAPVTQPTRLYPVELSVSAEDIAQFEAALAGEIALLDKDADEAESEAGRKKRRRRRRRGDRPVEVTTEAGTDTDEDSDGSEETDTIADVFGLGEIAQAASSFDADALLPLLSQDDSEAAEALGGGLLPSSHDLPIDLLADVMERLFALPELVETKPNTLPESPRRPTLDELLPFSNAPEDTGEMQTPETLFAEIETIELDSVSEEIADPDVNTAEESVTETEGEPMGLLSEGAVRTRRSRTAGGFASRLRRRAAERAPGDSDEGEVQSDAPVPNETDAETA